MESQIWQILMVFFLGGIFTFILLSFISLINSIRQTARQLEITAATLESILNSEGRALLNRGEKVLREFEGTLPLVKDKLFQISATDTLYAFMGRGSHLDRGLILWILKEAWRKVQAKRRKGGS